jgi:hypothetical protein
MSKRILVVAHDRPLRLTRVKLLEKLGYTVASAATDDEAMAILEVESFDLILLGHKSKIPKKGIDQKLREKYPSLLTLKIEIAGVERSIYPSLITDSEPRHVIVALHDMLGDDLQLIPVIDT